MTSISATLTVVILICFSSMSAFNITNLTANGSDYTLLTNSPLAFTGTANEVQTITVSVIGDVIVERSEQLRINLGTVTPVVPVAVANIMSGASGTGTITDNDTATFTIDNVVVGEADGNLVFNLVSSHPIDTDVIVTVGFNDQTAVGDGTDYNGTTQQITFAAGETSKTVSLSVRNDQLVETSETFLAVLGTTTPLSGRSLNLTDTGVGTITDNDTATFTINNVSAAEDATTISFDLVTDKPLDTAITIQVTFTNGTATGGGIDFTAAPMLIQFPAGLTSRPVTILISEDAIVEADETFTVELNAASQLGGRSVNVSDTGVGTILDNDAASVSILKLTDLNESLAPATGLLRVTQTSVSSTDTVVTYSVGGTATAGAGNDYVALTGTVTIPAGQTFADLPVSVLADLLVESTESVVITLTGFTSRDPEISLDPSPSLRTDTLFIFDDDQLILTNVSSQVVVENTATTTVVIDANSNPANAPGSTLSYSLSGADAAQFNINSVTGEVTFKNSPDFDLPADQGGNNVYNLLVTVTADTNPVRSTSQNVTVTVTGLNDNSPVFTNASPTFSVAENSQLGVTVGGVIATDLDRPQQTMSYAIVSGNLEGAFAINPATGQITVADSTQLNFESTTTTFTFTVRATDNGSPTNSTDAVIVVHVTNVFEGPTITIPNATGSFQPGIDRVPVAPDAEFTYGDVATPSFNGTTLVVSIASGRMSRDQLSIAKSGDPTGQITTKRRAVFANGEQIGTYSVTRTC